MTVVFDWREVDITMTRRLIAAAYRWTTDTNAEAKASEALVRGTSADAKLLQKRLGVDRWASMAAEVIREYWIPKLPKSQLELVVYSLIQTTHGPPAQERPSTKAEMIAWLEARNNTINLSLSLWRAFRDAHRSDNGVMKSPPGTVAEGRWYGAINLEGRGEKDKSGDAWDYQRDAWTNLDELAQQSVLSSPRKSQRHGGGLITIPTGGGKTYTAVRWLVDQLGKDTNVRVLWIADKQELVNQAAEEFLTCAPLMPSGRMRVMRVIHGNASPVAMISDPDVNIMCITRQSLHGKYFDKAAKNRIKAFVSQPVIVVVDEAHHAVSASYHETLDYIASKAPASMMIGLTATPWPSGAGMRKRLLERFPTLVATADTVDLIRRGILARPVVHTQQTNEFVEFNEEELKRLHGPGDLPVWVTDKLNRESRNRLIVTTWKRDRKRWGKTLVFVGSIAHADALGELFKAEKVPTDVVHSRSDEHYSTVLARFKKASKPRVLVSVAQLLEGINVPSARTAILARPTRSPILLRQMIGRVLRGPKAGGDPEAHIIDVRDNWQEDLDILSPRELVGLTVVIVDVSDGGELVLPPLLDEVTSEEIPPDLDARIGKYFREMLAERLLTDMLMPTRLTGYYQLDDRNVPVFDHAAERWKELLADRLRHAPKITSPIAFFGDLPFPRPLKVDVDAAVDYVRSYEGAPPFHEIQLTLSPRDVAAELSAVKPMNEQARWQWLRDKWRTSLARHAYRDFSEFRSAVDRESDRLHQVEKKLDAENPSPGTRKRPRTLPASTTRSIQLPFTTAMAKGQDLLLNEQTNYRDHLVAGPTLSISWTKRPVQSTLAYWAPRISGKSAGTSVICVNLALRAPKRAVSEAALEYLIWHELCHYITPGRGHDAEFRRLEALWPESTALDQYLESLCEDYDLSRRKT